MIIAVSSECARGLRVILSPPVRRSEITVMATTHRRGTVAEIEMLAERPGAAPHDCVNVVAVNVRTSKKGSPSVAPVSVSITVIGRRLR